MNSKSTKPHFAPICQLIFRPINLPSVWTVWTCRIIHTSWFISTSYGLEEPSLDLQLDLPIPQGVSESPFKSNSPARTGIKNCFTCFSSFSPPFKFSSKSFLYSCER